MATSSALHPVQWGARLLRVALLLAAWLPLLPTARADDAPPVRLAILRTDAPEAMEALLVAELSKTPDVALVERAELERVAREHALSRAALLKEQLRLAALLHADGLLILGRESGNVLSVRLTAAGPGVVVGSALFAMREGDPEGLAAGVVSRFRPLLRKLAVRRGEALPISLLRLRASVKSPATQTLEDQLAFLFANRLVAQPGVFVLERWRLGDAAWEKTLAEGEEGSFWTGAYLVDGEITTAGNLPAAGERPVKVQVKVVARAPDGKTVKTLEEPGESDKLPELAERLAKRLVALLTPASPQSPAAVWSPQEESREYLREAEWALEGSLFPLARDAQEAAGALGNREQKYFRQGVNIYAGLIGKAREMNPREAPEWLDYARRVLESLEGYAAAPDQPYVYDGKPQHWSQYYRTVREYVGLDALDAATKVLRAAHERGVRGEEPALAEIRALARRCFAIVLAWGKESGRVGGLPYVKAAASYPYWADTPAEALETCRLLLRMGPPEALGGQRSAIRQRLLRGHFSGLHPTYSDIGDLRTIPHTIDWSGQAGQSPEALWRGFIEALLASPDPRERRDGMLFRIVEERAANEARVREALAAFWDARKELAEGQLIGALVGTLDACLRRNAPHLFTGEDRLRWLLYFLENARYEDARILTFWAQDSFTEQEADAVCKGLRIYRRRAGNREAGQLCQRIEDQWMRRYPSIRPPAPEGSLRVARFYPIPGLTEAGASRWVALPDPWGDELWFCAMAQTGGDDSGALYRFSVPDFQLRERVALPPGVKRDFGVNDRDAFCVGGEAVYYKTRGEVARYDRKARTWRAITLPGDSDGHGWRQILPVGEDFFVGRTSNSSRDHVAGIWKWVAATGEFETLASNRRRPARNRLDDSSGYNNTQVFNGPHGRLGCTPSMRVYLFNPQTAQWDTLPDVGEATARVAVTGDYTLMHFDNGALGLLRHPGGKASGEGIEWFRGESPAALEADKKRGGFMFANRWNFERTLAWNNGTVWHCQPRNQTPSRHHLLRRMAWENTAPSTDSKTPPKTPDLPLDFELPAAVQAALSGSNATHPLDALGMIASREGLIFWAHNLPGFWFVPYAELEAADGRLGALQKAPRAE